ncbi:GreA/GreB family elongation factor [Sporichthya polymorpha]|uniref:GreA/GreB family elongation factor n=1 Tax=Sporichthya polymorpha TaxID=35751 RepID=UPI00037C5CA6|nr:GreA/GreB family elongation factor [Sporichthya polymorpha]
MSAATPDVRAGARTLRARVRELLEEEYRRLRELDRESRSPAELELIDRRIRDVHDYLGTVVDRAAGVGIGVGTTVVIDDGKGPRTVLVSPLEVYDPDALSAEDGLGRALIGARPGDRVRYATPDGPTMVRVVAVGS